MINLKTLVLLFLLCFYPILLKGQDKIEFNFNRGKDCKSILYTRCSGYLDIDLNTKEVILAMVVNGVSNINNYMLNTMYTRNNITYIFLSNEYENIRLELTDSELYLRDESNCYEFSIGNSEITNTKIYKRT